MKSKYFLILALVAFVDLTMTVKLARADYLFGTPTLLPAPVNSSFYDFSPSLSSDGLELYFTSNRPGGAEGYCTWVSKRNLTSEPFSSPQIASYIMHSSISDDGLSLYGNDPGPYGKEDIHVVTRPTKDDPWGPEMVLNSNVNSDWSERFPEISSSGLELYLTCGSDYEAGILVCKRSNTSQPFGPATWLPDSINVGYAWFPALSDDELTMFFSSNRRGGYGNADIYIATRPSKDSPWGEPYNAGPKINTAQIELAPEISSDGRMLYFTRGTSVDLNLWEAPILDPFSPADFNNDGDIDSDDFHAWEIGFGIQIEAQKTDGDADGDGDVDGNDFLTWQQEYGSGSISSASIPEPSTFIVSSMLTMIGIALAHYRTR